jgi:hypothetical protein
MTYSGPCELFDSEKRFVEGRIFLVAGHEEAGHPVGLKKGTLTLMFFCVSIYNVDITS